MTTESQPKQSQVEKFKDLDLDEFEEFVNVAEEHHVAIREKNPSGLREVRR